MSLINRCLYLDSRHNLELRERPVPEPGTGEVLVKIQANGICGSDVHFYKEGRLGNFIVTQPYVPGHEASGTIALAGAGVKQFKEGDSVVIEPGIPCGCCFYCKSGRYNLCPDVVFLSALPVNGTFCDYLVIPETALHPMPDGMDFHTAAVAEPAAVAVHAINRAHVRNGASAVVAGTGPIGLLVLQAFKAAGGGQVICTDISEKRLELAARLGADKVINVSRDGIPENAGEYVFETAGSAAVSSQLFTMAAPGGTVVQVGWPGGNIVSMNIANFLDKELNYLGVNRYANAFPAAIRYLADGRIRTDGLISHKYPLSRAVEAFQKAADSKGDAVKIIVYNEE
jgi:L-iditol 2-dehydrogenase